MNLSPFCARAPAQFGTFPQRPNPSMAGTSPAMTTYEGGGVPLARVLAGGGIGGAAGNWLRSGIYHFN